MRRGRDTVLNRLLQAGGIRRIDLAARAGCGLETLERISSGRVGGMRLETLLRVSASLGVAPAELVPALGTRPRGGLLAERGIRRQPSP